MMSGNCRPFKEDITSYKKTGIPCGNPRRYESHAVTKMCPSGPPIRNHRLDMPVEDIETEGDRQLRLLLKRQLDTDLTIDGQLAKKKVFAAPIMYDPLRKEVAGPRTLAEFQSKVNENSQLEELRKSGLSEDEIKFKMELESDKIPKKTSGYGLDPSALTAKLNSINEKIQAHVEFLNKPVKFAAAKVMTRHEMDLELAISHDKEKSKLLDSLMVQGKSLDPSYDDKNHPINHLDSILEEALGKRRVGCSRSQTGDKSSDIESEYVGILPSFNNDTELSEAAEELQPMPEATCAPKPKRRTDKFIYVPEKNLQMPQISIRVEESSYNSASKQSNESDITRKITEHVEPIPKDAICKYKLSLEDIKKLERFKNYEPGFPSNTLFLKNLSGKVSEIDLVSLFHSHQKADATPIQYRLMTSRMKGQAFVTFHDVETATEAMDLVNGYHFKGKPIIIQYGKK